MNKLLKLSKESLKIEQQDILSLIDKIKANNFEEYEKYCLIENLIDTLNCVNEKLKTI